MDVHSPQRGWAGNGGYTIRLDGWREICWILVVLLLLCGVPLSLYCFEIFLPVAYPTPFILLCLVSSVRGCLLGVPIPPLISREGGERFALIGTGPLWLNHHRLSSFYSIPPIY